MTPSATIPPAATTASQRRALTTRFPRDEPCRDEDEGGEERDDERTGDEMARERTLQGGEEDVRAGRVGSRVHRDEAPVAHEGRIRADEAANPQLADER